MGDQAHGVSGIQSLPGKKKVEQQEGYIRAVRPFGSGRRRVQDPRDSRRILGRSVSEVVVLQLDTAEDTAFCMPYPERYMRRAAALEGPPQDPGDPVRLAFTAHGESSKREQ